MTRSLETKIRCSVATLRNSVRGLGVEPPEGKDCCGSSTECFIWQIPGITQQFRVVSIACAKAAKRRAKAVEDRDMNALREAIAEHEMLKEQITKMVKELKDEK